MAVLDGTYINNAIGASEYTALFTDAGTLNTAAQTQLIASAVARANDALLRAGYATFAVSATSVPVTVSDCALGVFVRLAYGRKGLAVPDQYATFTTLEERIGDGTIPVSGMTPTAQDAVGGVSFSDQDRDSTASTARPQMFSRYRLSVY